MFQLVAAVLAIVLLGTAVISVIWVGGDAFFQNQDKAMYAEFINNATQIDGAMQLYFNDHVALPPGEDAELIQALVDGKYLVSPPPGTWLVDATRISKVIEGERQCEAMNRVAGFDTSSVKCPPCGDGPYSDWPACVVSQETPEG